MVTAYAIAGDLTFNPEKDTLIGADGKEVMLDSPFGDSLPQKGFDRGETGPCNDCPALSHICVCGSYLASISSGLQEAL